MSMTFLGGKIEFVGDVHDGGYLDTSKLFGPDGSPDYFVAVETFLVMLCVAGKVTSEDPDVNNALQNAIDAACEQEVFAISGSYPLPDEISDDDDPADGWKKDTT